MDALPWLLEQACPSIRYRVRAEILGQPATDEAMRALQALILQDPAVRTVLSWQQPDGWLAQDFHGAQGLEAGVRILMEKGVEPAHPAVTRALEALEAHPERLERGIGKVGKIIDEQGLGGAWMIRATVFAYAGQEHRPGVQAQVEQALAGFRAVLGVRSLDEVAVAYRGKLVFRPGVLWPSIYHLRLLAFTQAWRSAENLSMLAEAIQRLAELSPIPDILVRHGSQLISPASFCMHDFNPEMESMDAADWMMWFQRMECLARLGVVAALPALQRQVADLQGRLDAQGAFTQELAHPYFAKWGSYTGLRLEQNWRASGRRVCDLTFRSMLILHYAEG